MRAPWRNPIVKLETRRRFASFRYALALPLVMFLPAVVVCLIYATQTDFAQNEFVPQAAMEDGAVVDADPVFAAVMGDPTVGIEVPGGFTSPADRFWSDTEGAGRAVFYGALIALTLVSIIMVPAMLGPSISTDRAELTLQSVQLTSLTPADIALGKLVAPLMYLMWLFVGMVPLTAIAYALGGVRKSTLLYAFVALALFVVELAVVSLSQSALSRRPGASTVRAVVVVIALCIIPLAVAGTAAFWWSFQERQAIPFEAPSSPPEWIAYLSAPSPLMIGSLPTTSDIEMSDAADGVADTLRWFSLASALLVIAVSWRLTVRGLTTPTENDR